MKASAIAHPIQGLVKYHGLRDPRLRIPFHDSVSVCTGPIRSHTTVELGGDADRYVIDGKAVTGRAKERMTMVLDAIRTEAGSAAPCRVESSNDFPQFVGLGSSSSGFAALAVAAAKAYGWETDAERLSEVARLGAGSASRAVTGGVSEWVVDGERSYARMLMAPDACKDWRIVVPLVMHEEPTEGVHAEVLTSPFFDARLAYLEGALRDIRAAAKRSDLEALWAIAERDTLNLHAVTMTGKQGHFTWQPATMAVMRTVRRLREGGLPVYFSIDTGATAYLNTHAKHVAEVAEAVSGIPGVARVLHLDVGGPARLVSDHRF